VLLEGLCATEIVVDLGSYKKLELLVLLICGG
jgi:hypothetical protein